MQRTRPRTLKHSLSGPGCPDVQLQAARKVLCWFLLCLYCPLYIVLQHFNVLHYVSQLPSNSTTNSQRLSFSLLIILYCLFIVPECSTTLFVHMSMSSALVLLLLDAGRLPVCLLACCHGDIGLSPHI